MKKRAELSDRPEVAQHLHEDTTVTRQKLDAFVQDADSVQLLVLAELRSRAADQETSLVLTLQAATVTILAVMLARIPTGTVASSSNGGWPGLIGFAIAALVLAAIAIVLNLPSVRHAVIGNRNRLRAVVWLAAYEQALTEHAAGDAARTGRRLRRVRPPRGSGGPASG